VLLTDTIGAFIVVRYPPITIILMVRFIIDTYFYTNL